MTDAFQIDSRLSSTSVALGRLGLSFLRLVNDRRFPWLLLIPEKKGVTEVFELSALQRAQLAEEISLVADALKRVTGAEKINVGALGNLVPQLHFHVVARFRTDAAWPGPVWGCGAAEPYDERALEALTIALKTSIFAPNQS